MFEETPEKTSLHVLFQRNALVMTKLDIPPEIRKWPDGVWIYS